MVNEMAGCGEQEADTALESGSIARVMLFTVLADVISEYRSV
jgi:hypothetical protein